MLPFTGSLKSQRSSLLLPTLLPCLNMISLSSHRFPALIQLTAPKLPFRTPNLTETKLVSRGVPQNQLHSSFGSRLHVNCAISRSDRESGFKGDGFQQEPFWSTLFKDAFWGLKLLLAFLVEQPGQLKYIEWPSFQSTLRTATLTLVLVAILIVALSSIDSMLSYVLALLLRRTA